MKNWHYFLIALIVALAAFGVWWFAIRKKSDNPLNPGGDTTTPGDTAKGYADTAADALAKAQAAETQAKLDPLAGTLVEITNLLAELEAKAIADPTPANRAAADAAEAQAATQRSQLAGAWQTALSSAENSMNTAMVAASNAVAALKSKIASVLSMKNAVIMAEKNVESAQLNLAECKKNAVWWIDSSNKAVDAAELALQNAADMLNSLQTKYTTLVSDATNTRISAESATTSANLCIERVESIAADLRILQILLTESARLDSIAKAARNKIYELQTQIQTLRNQIPA